MKKVTQTNLIIALVLTSLFIFVFNCGGNSGKGKESDELISDAKGRLDIDVKFPEINNQIAQKFFTYNNIVADSIPDPTDLSYRIEVNSINSEETEETNEYFSSFDSLSENLIDLTPGFVNVTVEAYLTNDDTSLGNMVYSGGSDVLIIADFTVTLEVLLNEVESSEVSQAAINVAIEINNNPVIQSVSVNSVTLEITDHLNYSVVAYDPDGDLLRYSWNLDGDLICSNPDGCDSPLPSDITLGEHTLTIKITDSRGGFESLDFQFTVYSNVSSPDIETNPVEDTIDAEYPNDVLIDQNDSEEEL